MAIPCEECRMTTCSDQVDYEMSQLDPPSSEGPDRSPITVAAFRGHFLCVAELVSRYPTEYPLPEQATYFAAVMGHLDCLKYLVQCGCPPSPYAISRATNLPCIRYCLIQQFPGSR